MDFVKEYNPISFTLSLFGVNKTDTKKEVEVAKPDKGPEETFQFGPMTLSRKFVFLEKASVRCLISPSPIMPGRRLTQYDTDILIVPKRKVQTYSELNGTEIFDIALSCKYLSHVLQTSSQSKGTLIFIQVEQDDKELPKRRSNSTRVIGPLTRAHNSAE